MSVPYCSALLIELPAIAHSKHCSAVLGRHIIYWTMFSCPSFAQASMHFVDVNADVFLQGHRWETQLR